VYSLFGGFATHLFFWPDAAMSEFNRALEVMQTLPAGGLLLGDRLYCSIEIFLYLKVQLLKTPSRADGSGVPVTKSSQKRDQDPVANPTTTPKPPFGPPSLQAAQTIWSR
jgi:hypothetical protein